MNIAYLRPPRGLRDYPPEIWGRIKYLGESFLELASLWGYREVEAPALEKLEILEKKAGPNVRDEIYWFKDKGGRELGLIFDYTVPLARYIAANPSLPKPIKWCYFGRVWRYDEPQAGRWREFWQFGVELIGSDKVDADAEVIALMVKCLEKVGVPEPKVMVCDRRLVMSALDTMGIDKSIRYEVLRVIDKKKKISPEEFRDMLAKLGLEGKADDIGEFSSTLVPFNEAYEAASNYDSNIALFFRELSEILNEYGVIEKVFLDCSIVRGLDYYTGLVFEAFCSGGDRLSRLAIGGGGRYDELIGLYRKPGVPATGFALGVDRIAMALTYRGTNEVNIVNLYYMDKSFRGYAIMVAEQLRRNKIPVVLDFYSKSIRDSLKQADKRGYRFQIIIGRKEFGENKVTLKDLVEKTQETLTIEEAIARIRST